MPCGLSPNQCRRDHIAGRLEDAEADGTDFEARCPKCGHGGFRISHARVAKYRHVWTCACKKCRCGASDLRAELLRRGVSVTCLGIYDGPIQSAVSPEVARRLDLAVRDILALPQISPTDMRLILAEARGSVIPTETNAFVKFAMAHGAGRRQAYDAAKRWCRPADWPPLTGGGVVDTSRNTDATATVKPASQKPRNRAETAQPPCGNRAETTPLNRAESAQPDMKPAA